MTNPTNPNKTISATMSTLSEVLAKLKKDGYSMDFNLKDNCLICNGNALQVFPEDFVVDKHYRFEGITDPADEAIVYAISSEKHQIKGVLVNGYGPSSDPMTDKLITSLSSEGPATGQ
ncbi:hypothetical protein B0I27_11038 [Arcticibacter pallidicorallinus]|uniref:Phosphoribosylpyrophosphate synthetase n=1 Tax=Arcticibacter pallidicorallinus TaxID=1259464 RepID=A0A2T0TW02_9SPHI|nr:phosphoribosylpyrophosphate synthetase [Arcticibacter pallidicorallinus]PRY49864.1 hypothetical protein B0I27_11038 [Arcticibacter pallidicorallinus]